MARKIFRGSFGLLIENYNEGPVGTNFVDTLGFHEHLIAACIVFNLMVAQILGLLR